MRISACDGTPFPGGPIALGTGTDPRVACNDDRCAVVWHSGNSVSLKRFDAQSGVFFDTTPITFEAANLMYGPEIASDSNPTPNLRTFMVVWTSNTTGVSARRIRSQGALVAETSIATFAKGGAYTPSVASDGSQFMTSWFVGGALYSRLVDATSGNVIGAGATTLGTPTTSGAQATTFRARLAFDGASFVATWNDFGAGKVRGVRVDKNNNVLDSTPFEAGDNIDYPPAVGASPWGRSLVASYIYDPTSLSTLVVGRFYDNPLGSGAAASSASCPITSGGAGTGGSSGANGSGGASGSGGGSVVAHAGAGGTTGASSGGTAGVLGSSGTAGGGTAGQPGSAGSLSSGGTSDDGGAEQGIAGQAQDGEAGSNAEDGGASSSSAGALQGQGGRVSSAGRSGNEAGGAGGGNGSTEDSSCGCRVAGQSESAKPFWLTGLLVAVFAMRRRPFGTSFSKRLKVPEPH